jgi:hypothetical protein
VNLDFAAERHRSPGFAALWMAVSILLSHALEFIVPGVWLLPVVAGGSFWLLFAHPLRRGEFARAIRLALSWAAMMVAVQVTLTLLWPELMEANILRASIYRDEMFHWIGTGQGPEGDISLFLPIHLRHLAVFCVLGVASGGLLALMIGAALLGYMNFYVGSLIAASGFSPVAFLLGWQVWAAVRVTGFIIAGTALGAVLTSRNGQGAGKKRKILSWLAVALALVVADILLKWALAGFYQQALNGVIGG